MIHLSVIVPMFNVEPYVERCIRSLEQQDIPAADFEIICINDGSPDNCREVVLRMKAEYNNLILIDQDNKGVSCARNAGIERASGNYIMFIDPDDFVEPNVFSATLNTIEKAEAQVCYLGYTVLHENGTVRKRVYNEEYKNRVFSGTEAYFLSRNDGQTDPDRMVAVLFETTFLNQNNLRYLTDVPYLEDGEFIVRILCLADRCTFYGDSFYQRTVRPGSATHSNLFYTERATNGFLLAARNLKSFQQKPCLNESQKKFLNQPICKFAVLVVESASRPFNLKRVKKVGRLLLDSGLGKLDLESVDKEYTNLGYFYNKSLFCLIINRFLNHLGTSVRLLLKL